MGNKTANMRVILPNTTRNRQSLFTFQSGTHRWYSWPLWRSPHHQGSSGSSCGPWSYCRFPPESRRRTECHLRGKGTKSFTTSTPFHRFTRSNWHLCEAFTDPQASRKWRRPLTTSHIPSRSTRLLPETSAPLERCSLECRQPCHSAPSQSATQIKNV